MIKKQRTEAAYELVLHSADVNAVGENGNTPLHFAVLSGNLQLIKVRLHLMKIGANETKGFDIVWRKLPNEK